MAREITAQDRVLEKIPLFTSLTAEELQQVREKFVIKRFKKNEVILREEDTNEYMYIILDGEAKVVNTNEKEKDILITMHRSGDFFGELSLIDGKTVPATVIAAKDSITAIISKKDFYSLLFSQSKVIENLLQILCSTFRDSLKKIQMLNIKNAAQRVKMLFLMLSETHGEKTDGGTILNIRLLHQDIAGMTGLTRETVTRVLDKLQRSGEIKILKNRFILLCPEFESITLY
jgi:CRP/FNR family cyclic AMP-dependent transcriptional regulator